MCSLQSESNGLAIEGKTSSDTEEVLESVCGLPPVPGDCRTSSLVHVQNFGSKKQAWKWGGKEVECSIKKRQNHVNNVTRERKRENFLQRCGQ